MAKISANYEVVYIIDPAQSEEAIAATVAKFQTLAEQNGSDVVVDEWGKRRLAYAIDYKTEGYYVLMSFTSGPEFPKELDRILGITEAAAEVKAPVILQVSRGARAYANHTYLVKLVEAAEQETGLPIALHLDHGDSFELCKSCVDFA